MIGLEWEQAHAEACWWERVMSEAVERRVLELLKYPMMSPRGIPIPGLDELGHQSDMGPVPEEDAVRLGELNPGPNSASPLVGRLEETAQTAPPD